MHLRVTAEIEESGFRQTAWLSRDMRAGDQVLVEVIDSEHIAVTTVEQDGQEREHPVKSTEDDD